MLQFENLKMGRKGTSRHGKASGFVAIRRCFQQQQGAVILFHAKLHKVPGRIRCLFEGSPKFLEAQAAELRRKGRFAWESKAT